MTCCFRTTSSTTSAALALAGLLPVEMAGCWKKKNAGNSAMHGPLSRRLETIHHPRPVQMAAAPVARSAAAVGWDQAGWTGASSGACRTTRWTTLLPSGWRSGWCWAACGAYLHGWVRAGQGGNLLCGPPGEGAAGNGPFFWLLLL
ncbi:unnamed protein product, partial [Heterosigma akashiwo]